MAWNRPTSNTVDATSSSRPSGRGKMPRLRRGLIAGVIVVLGAGLAAWLLTNGEEASSPLQKKDRGLIKEVTPAAAPKREPSSDAGTTAPGPKMKEMRISENSPVRHEPLIRQEKRTNRVYTTHYEGKVIHRNGIEQAMINLFTCPLGRAPIPIPFMTEEDNARVLEILADTNKFEDDDTDRERFCRQVIADAKLELAKYLDEGGNVTQFFRFYHDELINAFHLRQDAELEVRRIMDEDGDEDLARSFQRKANGILGEKGIVGLDVVEDDADTKEESSDQTNEN